MSNRLADAASPYLRQHADNPVDWYPWGEEALARAREESRPILLSIGYSACHWCHVMAHESFTDPAIARIMNAGFVNIKVDREERPDLDQVYQLAQQMMTRRAGGWPLTVFLTPDLLPFYGGTYFPKSPRYGLPGFGDLLQQILTVYHQRGEEVQAQATALGEALGRLEKGHDPAEPPRWPSAAQAALTALGQHFDRRWGGLGDAPKFPQVPTLEFLALQAAQGNALGLEMLGQTLAAMARGGLFDQIGGGFFRYSVDARWEIPHFEKMLYDNGQMLSIYALGYALHADPLYVEVMEASVSWLMREMRGPEGGFYSALDADSAGEEGHFYLWQRSAVENALDPELRALALRCWGLDRPANFEGRAWHLQRSMEPAAAAMALGEAEGTAAQNLQRARERLFHVRAERPRPGLDDKRLCAWNALTLRGLALAGRTFGRQEWIRLAQETADFLRARLWQNGRLYAVWKEERAYQPAYLDDHAFLLQALLELLQGEFRIEDLHFARDLADALLDRFMDARHGGFFFTADDQPAPVTRMKPSQDQAIPTGNGVAILALQRLGHLLGEGRYLDAAALGLQAFGGDLEEHGLAVPTLLCALREAQEPLPTMIIRGSLTALESWRATLSGQYPGDRVMVFIANGMKDLPPILERAAPAGGRAWLCRGLQCLAPVDSPEELLALLE
ncbi:thioredoxin domain-containing protein [Acidithiobacillus sulfuriphilus]|uniref:Thioredoxin domain-containing protein n=2 Tax=Acidithiobacillus sulfuriphilus TaxID=1867749 RepID=A0A3M8R2F6_9PROT|nr:thioredoxin domain-containing protein [Acidithiobacillus sulfuriphilus]RNF62241.1 thioredoxin domain-containing protein [Acidithiobacillus sulfuriphilus]